MAYRAHIASVTLPAAGAWKTDAAAQGIPGSWRESRGTKSVSVLVTYTAGASGGYPKIRPVWTHVSGADGTTQFLARDTTNNGTATASAPNITVDNYLSVFALKGLTDGSAEKASVMLIVPPDAVALKIECAEVGNTGTPGTILVHLDGGV